MMTDDDGWISPVFAGSRDAAALLPDRAEDDARGRATGDELVARVVQTVRDIPSGCAMTYGDVAAIVGCGPRQVGRIMATSQHDMPWWRVTNASGMLPEDLRREAHAHYAHEGTPVRGARVDLVHARWRPA